MTEKLELRRLARDSGLNLVRFGWGLLVGMFISIILARGLGKEARGIYTLAVLLPDLMVTFLNLGIGPATVYFIGRGDYDPVQAARKNIGLAFWVSIGSVVAGFCLVSLAGNLLFPGVPRLVLLVGLLIIPVNLLTAYLVSILHGLQNFRLFNLIGVVSQLMLLVLAGILVWVFRKGVLGALISLLLGNSVGLVLLVLIIKRKTTFSQLIDLRLDLAYTRKILRYGLKAHLSNIVGYLNYRADNYILNYLAGVGQVGIYSISVSLAERLWIPSTAIATVILPRIASLNNDEDTRKQITPLTARFVLWTSLLMSISVGLLANWGIVFLYTAEYQSSAMSLRLLLPGIVLFNLTRILANDIAGRGHPELNLYQSAAALVVNITANLILIPRLGAAGAALSSTISYTLLAVLTTIVYCRMTGLSWRQVILIQPFDLQNTRKALGMIVAAVQSWRKGRSSSSTQL